MNIPVRIGPVWTETMVAELRRLWSQDIRASDIGKMLGGFTKNAIIGKARRIGLERKKPVAQKKEPRPKEARLPKAERNFWTKPRHPRQPKAEIVHIDDALIPIEQRKSLMQLTPFDCHFPIGDPLKGFWCNDAFFYCGAAATHGEYCTAHFQRMHR